MALYFGVLDIRRTGSEYAEIYNLIYDCFELDTIFLYPGLQINEIFLKINRTELNDLKDRLEQLAPKVEFKELNQKLSSFHLSYVKSDLTVEKRIEHVSGVNVERDMTINCCDYQKKLISKFAQTKYFNESNILPFQESAVAISADRLNTPIRATSIATSTKDLMTDDEDDANYENYMKTRANRNKPATDVLYQSYSSFDEQDEKNIRFQFRFKNFIELELTTNDMTELTVDGVVNLSKYDLESTSYDIGYAKILQEKCGLQYETELNELKKDKYSMKRTYESGTVVATSAGSVKHFQFVLHSIVPIGWSFYSNEQKYNELFFIYLNILNYADKQLDLKSLAIQLVDFIYSDEVNYKINALALIEALKTFCQDEGTNDYVQVNSLKKIFICIAKNSKVKQLVILRQYLTSKNYLNLSLFDLNLDLSQPNRFTTELVIKEPSIRNLEIKRESIKEKKTQIEEKKCSCGSTKNLILNEAGQNNCQVENCEICKILLYLIDNARKKLQKSNICFNCAIEILFNSLKNALICACCYRAGNDTKVNANKICNLHSFCDKCLKTVQYGNTECKFCYFNKLNQLLTTMTENSLFEKHSNIQCSYDFCDLKNQSMISSNPRKNENTPTSELKCGHSSCTSVCSFCAFKKIFEINNTLTPEVSVSIEVKDESLEDDTFERSHERGPQPEGGKMETYILGDSLPGFSGSKTILIEYNFPDGVFHDRSSNKAIEYHGKKKNAYLPATTEGNRLCKLLQKAFDFGHVFTLTYSSTYNFYYLTFNNITHKTQQNGEDGYPDFDYLNKLKEELAIKGFN